MAAEVFPVARIDEYAKPCEPAIHVLRSVIPLKKILSAIYFVTLDNPQKSFHVFSGS